MFDTVLNPGLSDASGDLTQLSLFDVGLLTSGLADLSFSLSFLPIAGIMFFDGEMSFPILLHVCANNANGLFLASSCKNKHEKKIIIFFSFHVIKILIVHVKHTERKVFKVFIKKKSFFFF